MGTRMYSKRKRIKQPVQNVWSFMYLQVDWTQANKKKIKVRRIPEQPTGLAAAAAAAAIIGFLYPDVLSPSLILSFSFLL